MRLTTMKIKTWLKAIAWVIAIPIILFALVMVLLYVPPVQNFLRGQVTSIASEATGMDIAVDRIDLRFPLDLLVRGVTVALPADSAGTALPDTLLTLTQLKVSIQALPLFHGEVELDEVSLKNASLNSANLIDGIHVKGNLGSFNLESHGIDLLNETVILNSINLSDTYVAVTLTESTTEEAEADTTALDLAWKINLHNLSLENVDVDLLMPADTMAVSASLPSATIEDAEADLGLMRFGWRRFQLQDTRVNYDSGTAPATSAGIDPSHIALTGVNIGIDSVYYCGRDINAVIRELTLTERSGLSVASTEGRVQADSVTISVPYLTLKTPNSLVDLEAQTYWELVNIPTEGRLTARLNVTVGKQDVFLAVGDLPQDFQEAYPSRPLVIRAGTDGNLRQMQISRFNVDLPGAFALSGGGELFHLADSVQRHGSLDFEMHTMDLNFLTALAGIAPGGDVIVPDSMDLVARVDINGPRYDAMLRLQEDQGRMSLDATYNMSTEAYQANLVIDSLQVDHFLPNDSIYTASASLQAEGQGLDLVSPQTLADVKLQLDKLEYGHWNLHDVNLTAGLHNAVAKVNFTSENELLRMQTQADMRMDCDYLDGQLDLNVDNVDLHLLGIAPRPLKRPFILKMGAQAAHDSVKVQVAAGDLELHFRTDGTLKKLIEKGTEFSDLLMAQIEARKLDHAAMRQLLPTAGMSIKAGKQNPVAFFLETQDVEFDDFSLGFGFTPRHGINGRAVVHGLKTDSLQLDTIYFSVHQDTTMMRLQGGVINGPDNPDFTFEGRLTGEIRNEDAGLTLEFIDDKGETGVLLGVDAKPLLEGRRGNGLVLKLGPENPIIAYRKFEFKDKSKWIYLHNDMRVYADVNMRSDDGLVFSMKSDPRDTVSLQNMYVELSRLKLDELCSVIPYMPRIGGMFSAEANVKLDAESVQVAAEANVYRLNYEGKEVGNLGVGGALLPGPGGAQHVMAYATVDDEQVLSAEGMLAPDSLKKDTLNVRARLIRLPLTLANAFVPDELVSLSGHLNGGVVVGGTLDAPLINGGLKMDSVSVYVKQLGSRYWLSQRPITVRENVLNVDSLRIYTVSDNPFTINGEVNFQDFDNPTANITLTAKDYTLLQATRTRESLIYGKVVVDVNAFVRGPLNNLSMRGNMNLLGNTDVTYVLTNSPLTVEDRLEGLVTFVEFADTAAVNAEENRVSLPGGMSMTMTLHIDNAVRIRADLSADGSKFIELEGGGDLNLQYAQSGDMTLTGRYTLSGGTMKYSLPIIPLKEFEIANGSYVDWRGPIMEPTLNLTATETVRSSVSDDDGGSRTVSFNVSISISGSLDSPELVFDLSAPEDATVQNELQSMDAEERSKQAIAMLATGIYLANSGGSGLNMGSALNSVLQNQINALAGSALESVNASFSVGVEDNTSGETGESSTDYSFRYSQRFFNDRVQIVIGGTVSTGSSSTSNSESFIDNISLEYRLDSSGIRYVRAFYNKNNESILDGEITETGVGIVLRRKVDRLSELFLFKKTK